MQCQFLSHWYDSSWKNPHGTSRNRTPTFWSQGKLLGPQGSQLLSQNSATTSELIQARPKIPVSHIAIQSFNHIIKGGGKNAWPKCLHIILPMPVFHLKELWHLVDKQWKMGHACLLTSTTTIAQITNGLWIPKSFHLSSNNCEICPQTHFGMFHGVSKLTMMEAQSALSTKELFYGHGSIQQKSRFCYVWFGHKFLNFCQCELNMKLTLLWNKYLSLSKYSFSSGNLHKRIHLHHILSNNSQIYAAFQRFPKLMMVASLSISSPKQLFGTHNPPRNNWCFATLDLVQVFLHCLYNQKLDFVHGPGVFTLSLQPEVKFGPGVFTLSLQPEVRFGPGVFTLSLQPEVRFGPGVLTLSLQPDPSLMTCIS